MRVKCFVKKPHLTFISFIFLITLNVNANATTEYVVLERGVDKYIFSKYLDLLDLNKDIPLQLKEISLDNPRWKEASKNYHNTISAIYYSKSGDVFIENSKFEFKIIFSPTYINNKIRWTCKIEDKSLIFHPIDCISWSKEIGPTPETRNLD